MGAQGHPLAPHEERETMNRYRLCGENGMDSGKENAYEDILESEEPLTEAEVAEEAREFVMQHIGYWHELIEGRYAPQPEGEPSFRLMVEMKKPGQAPEYLSMEQMQGVQINDKKNSELLLGEIKQLISRLVIVNYVFSKEPSMEIGKEKEKTWHLRDNYISHEENHGEEPKYKWSLT